MAKNSYDHLFKLVLLGGSSVGKSSLMTRYTDDTYTDEINSTIGTDFRVKMIKFKSKAIKLQIWDTAGQEKFRSINTTFFRGVHGFIVVFDLNNLDSFKNVRLWIDDIKTYCANNYSIMLVGNKCDLPRVVQESDIKPLTDEFNISYFETSAKTDAGVSTIFETITELIYQKVSGKSASADSLATIKLTEKIYPVKKKSCC
jgi:Ras-related protein Rab-1A